MKKLKGPDLKMPELRVPTFLADLYYDLRDRRLLPLGALVIVAIAAVPFLLGGDREAAYVPPSADSTGVKSPVAKSSRLTVVEATPGLRDYRKRLDDRSPTNPFKQRYTGLPKGAQVESTTVSSSTAGTGGSDEASTVGVEEESTGETAPAPAGGSNGEGSQTYELVIDVQISRTEKTADGGEETGELEVRHDVPVLTKLPGKKTPVVTTMGANLSKERLVFLVSPQVTAIIGEFGCITRGEICELLEVAPGALLEFVYETGVRYTIKVTNVDAIPARGGARSSRAALARSYPGTALEAGSGSF